MINAIVVDEKNSGLYGGLLQAQFQRRYELFAENLGWDIPRSTRIERDQYDRAETVYILLEEDGVLSGYARLLPTTAQTRYGTAGFSYLVKDAEAGLLPGIPTGILSGVAAPVSSEVWEMTRVEANDRRNLEALFEVANRYLKSVGARSTITFTRKSFAGILNRLGYATKILGPDCSYAGKPYCAMATQLQLGQ
ncbi:acyl-homoserine-lactone synthase [Pseudophaeobacter arcticus]|jgi:acyl homoserine lactone synthase|uniref:acyl-homoserine-lactone synthase n=1 Tax=Pseudophaeobacter arcticus TaxID=385492 RepID=UPI000684D833|nr:acyl-homoserine-lactone synthase [Pseudophaeobacter arcticus]